MIFLASVSAQAMLLAGRACAADYVIAAGQTADGDQYLSADGDTLTVEQGGRISSTYSYGIAATADGQTITVNGEITGPQVGIGLTGQDSRVSIGTTGSIVNTGYGIFVDDSANAVTNAGTIFGYVKGILINNGATATKLVNTGVVGSMLNGVAVYGSGNTLINSGTISDDGSFGDRGSGVLLIESNQVVNTGDIAGTGVGLIAFYGSVIDNSGMISSDGYAIQFGGSNPNLYHPSSSAGQRGHGNSLSNSGDVSGGIAGIAVYGEDNAITNTGDIAGGVSGITVDGDGNDVANTGRVTGGTGYGIVLGGGDNRLTNSGRIESGGIGVGGFEGIQSVVNSGSILGGTGGIALGNDSLLVNTGSIDSVAGPGLWLESDNSIANAGIIRSGDTGLEALDGNIIANAGMIAGGSVSGVNLRDGNTLTNSGWISGGQFAISVNGTGNTIDLRRGTRLVGLLSIDAGNELVIAKGMNTAFAYTGAPSVTAESGVVAVTGGLVAAVDPTAISAEDDTLDDLARVISDAADGRIRATRGDLRSAAPSVWTVALGAARQQTAHGVDMAFDTQLAGLILGREIRVLSDWRIGAFVGAAVSQLDSESQAIDAQAGFAGVYGETRMRGMFLDLSVTVGASRQSSDRTVLSNSSATGVEYAKADYDAGFLGTSATLGKAVAVPGGILTPSLQLRGAAVCIGGVDEDGSAADMTVEERLSGFGELRALLGYDLLPWDVAGGSLSLAMHGGAGLTSAGGPAVEAAIAGASLDITTGDDGLSWRGFAGFDLSWNVSGSLSLGLGAEAGYGPGAATDLAARATLDVAF
ncbi:MAG: autotransporter domain-containing protein [Hyphomicrobiales bacterium]